MPYDPALPAASVSHDDQCAFRETVEQVTRRLNRDLAGPSGSMQFPKEAWAQLAESGLFHLAFPESDGGLGADLSTLAHVTEGFGLVCDDPGFAFIACTHLCSLGMPLARFASPEIRARYLPQVMDGSLVGAHAITEPNSGSSAFEMKTAGRLENGVWKLNGQKAFISNAPFADMIVVYARTDETKGTLGGFSAFLVPRDAKGLTIGEASEKIGLKTAQFSALFLDDVEVPQDHLLGRPGMGYSILDYVMKREILVTFAVHLGQMQRRWEQTRTHVRERNQFGKRISSFQAVSNRVVDDLIALETSRMWIQRAAAEIDRGAQGAREIAIAKLVCSEANLNLALNAVRLHGAGGYMNETGIGQSVTDALGGVIYSGTSDIQRNRIAATLGL